MTTSLSVDLVGCQTPRLASTPPFFACTLGQDAVDLAAHAGLVLDPWEGDVLRDSLNERRGGKWAAFEVGLIVPRQNGKGAIIEARQLAALFLTHDTLTIYSAHQFKTAKAMYRRLKTLVLETPDLARLVLNYKQSNEETGIELKTGEKLNYFARSSGSGRGFTGDTMIFDEAYDLDAELIADVLPTLSAVRNAQVWYVSSAGMEASEQLASIRARGLMGTEPRLMFREWSAPDDAASDDVDAWLVANPGIGFRLDMEYIQLVERASMTDEAFRRERMGIWRPPDTVEVAIPADDWSGLIDRTPKLAGPVALAVDITPDRRFCSIAAASLTDQGSAHLEIGFHERPSADVVALIVALVGRWDPCAVILDKMSPAASLVPDLLAAGIEPVTTSGQEMAAACGGLYDAVSGRSISHTGDPLLADALANASRREMQGGSWGWNRRNATPISPLVAATLARWGLVTFGLKVPPKKTTAEHDTSGVITSGLMAAGF